MLNFNKEVSYQPPVSTSRLFELARLIEQWADDKGIFAKATTHSQMLKLVEEVGETAAAIARGKHDEAMDGIGDVFVVITILSKMLGVSVEDCIELAYEQISKRQGQMSAEGVFIKSTEQIIQEGVK